MKSGNISKIEDDLIIRGDETGVDVDCIKILSGENTRACFSLPISLKCNPRGGAGISTPLPPVIVEWRLFLESNH